jgi:serine/threonine protein phosphatase PrpC
MLTNQNAVDFVRERISAAKVLSSICEDVMDRCLAKDPQGHGGLGCDNTTCVIVRFPKSS